MAENKRIGELEDAVKDRDRRIAELREEIDELRDLVTRQRENADDFHSVIDSWAGAFDMVQTEGGAWTNGPFVEQHNRLCDAYSDLVRRWNKYVPLINGRRQNVGRPLQASEAQCEHVLTLHKAGHSLRAIADETSLGLPTVRTIVGKKTGTDRTTTRHRERIDITQLAATLKRQRRGREGLPRRAQRVIEETEKLSKEARGLGRA